eukprot:237878_1
MSALDRFVSLSSNEHDTGTYYRIATQIDGELTKFGNDNTKDIMNLVLNGSFNRLTEILNALKKTADADKHGIAQKTYRGAVINLFSVLNKLMNETKTKLLIEVNKDNTINDTKIFALNQGLKDVANLVETISPHLYDDSEKGKVKKEEKELGLLLYDRLRQLMKAAIQSARQKEYKKCEKRLDNISRLMDYNICLYISVNENKNENNNDMKMDDNQMVTEYNNIQQQIDDELKDVSQQVENANQSLSNPDVFNPYSCLRLRKLYDQLAESQNEHFQRLWFHIHDEIINTIRNVLSEIKQRNNQIQMQTDGMENKQKQLMTYSQQEA